MARQIDPPVGRRHGSLTLTRKAPCHCRGLVKGSGSDLLSQAVTRQVPSALEGLTTVFGMGTGVSPPPLPPENFAPFDNRISDEDLQIWLEVKPSTY
jgi:hypothetical protein